MKQEDQIEQVQHQLDLEEHLEWHQRGWRFQRFGWGFILLFPLLAAIGLFGNGPLSKQERRAGTATVSYDRFFRHEAQMELKLDQLPVANGQVQVGLSSDYLHNHRIESILPAPVQVQEKNGTIFYLFKGTGGMKVSFILSPQQIGRQSGRLQVGDQSISFTQFIYP